jgi:two-component system, OmpR family, response regulator
MRILVVEDELKVQNFIKEALESSGMVVDAVEDLPNLLAYLKANSYDAVILDRLLKGKDSLPYLGEIRRLNPESKILFLSALSEVEEKVNGLTAGADDYLGKPFHVSELIARLRSITRRVEQQKLKQKDNLLIYEDLKIDLDTQRVFRGDNKIDLTGKEFKMLTLLAKHPGRIFSKTMLLDQVWDLNHYPESNVIEVTIANLRGKVDKGFRPLIQSRRGVGYWLGEP